MRKWTISSLLIIALLLAGMAGGNLTPAGAADTSVTYSSDQLLLKFKPDINEAIKSDILTRYKIKLIDTIDKIDVMVINLPAKSIRDDIRSLKIEESIEYIEPDFVASADLVPNDIFYAYQWGLNTINAPQAWEMTRGSDSIMIAVCDTGISQNHPDLAGKVKASRNFTASKTTDDKNGHGTHVAGIAAAVSNNKAGIAGAGYDSGLMNVKVLGDNGIGFYSWAAKGIIWAADNGAKVINLSLGGNFPSRALESAVNYAWNDNCVIVASAGNDSSDRFHFPAGYVNCLAVAATDKADNKASSSNYGSWVDLACPGVDIYSTLPNVRNSTKYLNYGCLSGTSTAAPFASGIAALLWTTKYGTNSLSIANQLVNSGDQTGTIWTRYSIKRLNALNAVK
jgi:thermitase